MKTFIITLLVLGLIAVGGWFAVAHYMRELPPSYRTAEVKRGELLSVITATGTIEPEEVVDVGAQVAGLINKLGRDPSNEKKTIDYGSVVKADTVLAEIDPTIYQAQVEQAEAALARAQADLKQSQAKVEQTKKEWERAQKLFAVPNKPISDSDYDLADANYKSAEANVAVSEATIKQNEAALRLAKRNLDYTTIKSPVEGVIIDRRVNVGQTVVASLNAPSLFLIAKDLRHLQVWASVNEADIGRVKTGLPVKFTVDAFPGQSFEGKVAQVRLNATMTQNVVTYTVVVETDNSDLQLKPYMTANLRFEIEKKTDVLVVGNGALRYKPKANIVAPDQRDEYVAALANKGASRGEPAGGSASGEKSGSENRPTKDKATGGKEADKTEEGNDSGSEKKNAGEGKREKKSGRNERGRLWVRDGDFVRSIEVKLGATDGLQTEVRGKDVGEGMEVVIGENKRDQAGASDTTNPFAPKMFGGPKKN